MLLTLRRPAIAVFVPVSFCALGAGMVAASVERLREEPSLGAGIGALVSAAIAAFVLGMVRVAWIRDTELVVAGLFGRQRLVLSDAALGAEAKSSGRSIEYEVYGTDGGERVVFFGAWSRWGAERARGRLARTFGLEDGESRRGLTEVKRAEAREAAQAAQVKAYLEAHNRGGGKQVMIALAIFVALYALGMAAYLATQ